MPNIGLYLLALVALWISSKVIVETTEKIAKFMYVPPFILSFVLLGFMTSSPEIGLLVNSISLDKSEVFVGNLLGGIFTLFGLVIPLLLILKNKLNISHEVKSGMMAEICLLLAYPVVTTIDGRLVWWEGILCVVSYVALAVYFVKKEALFIKNRQNGFINSKLLPLIVKIGLGLFVLLYASRILVGGIEMLSDSLNLPVYLVSFLFSPLATNLPELSIIFQSLGMKKVDVALGDYLGSASTNVILLGLGVLASGKEIILPGSIAARVIYLAVLLALFYFFTRIKGQLNRKEGVIMLIGYIIFVLLELTI